MVAAYKTGELDPETCLGFATITEYVVIEVLGDATKERFGAPYDIFSKSLGKINVKYSTLHYSGNSDFWHFVKNINSEIPDYYICLGMDRHQTEILKVWVIPGNSSVVTAKGIRIYPSTEERFIEYSVNHEIYDKTFQDMDIKEKPEFVNTTKPKVNERRYHYRKCDQEIQEIRMQVRDEPPSKNQFMLDYIKDLAPLHKLTLLRIVRVAQRHKLPLNYSWIVNHCINVSKKYNFTYVTAGNLACSISELSTCGIIKAKNQKIRAINTSLSDIEEAIFEDPEFSKLKECDTQ